MVAEREMPARQCTMTWQLDSLALSGGRGPRGPGERWGHTALRYPQAGDHTLTPPASRPSREQPPSLPLLQLCPGKGGVGRGGAPLTDELDGLVQPGQQLLTVVVVDGDAHEAALADEVRLGAGVAGVEDVAYSVLGHQVLRDRRTGCKGVHLGRPFESWDGPQVGYSAGLGPGGMRASSSPAHGRPCAPRDFTAAWAVASPSSLVTIFKTRDSFRLARGPVTSAVWHVGSTDQGAGKCRPAQP